MRLLIFENELKHEYKINSKEDIIEGIKDFVQLFIPEDDELLYDLYKNSQYEELKKEFVKLNQINLDYLNSRKMDDDERALAFIKMLHNNISTREAIELLEKIEEMGNLSDICHEIDEFVKIFKMADYDIEIAFVPSKEG